MTETRIIRRHDVIAIRKGRDQIAKHLRCSLGIREQEKDGPVSRPRLAVEDVETLYLRCPVVHDWQRLRTGRARKKKKRGEGRATVAVRMAASIATNSPRSVERDMSPPEIRLLLQARAENAKSNAGNPA